MPPDILSNRTSEEGELVRLLIVEVGNQPGDPAGVREAMGLMKRVLENRLKTPQDFNARGATTMAQIIQAHGKDGKGVQFAGFQDYPKLALTQQNAIDADLKEAATLGRQNDSVRSLFATAFTVARAPTMVDPSPGGLYFWKTTGHSLGLSGYKLYRTVVGIDFYQKINVMGKNAHHGSGHASGPMAYDHGRPKARASDSITSSNGPMIYSHKRPGPK